MHHQPRSDEPLKDGSAAVTSRRMGYQIEAVLKRWPGLQDIAAILVLFPILDSRKGPHDVTLPSLSL